MGIIFHKKKKYGGTGVKVQSDASATSLNALDVPNGQTIESVLNSKLNYVTVTLSTDSNGNCEIPNMPVASSIVIGARVQGVIAIPSDMGGTNWYLACTDSNMSKVTFSNRPKCRIAYITI